MKRNHLLALLFMTFSFSLFAQNYTVQLAAFNERVPVSYFKDSGLQDVYMEIDHNNFYRYFTGKFTDVNTAENRLSMAKAAGISNARIVDLSALRNCRNMCAPRSITSACVKGDHIVYNPPASRAPKSLPRLGTNPQFGTLRFYTTTQQVYDHLKGAYVKNEKGNAAELDKLWNAMGYSGFNDPRFLVSSVTPIFYDAGIKGMLGAGGNTYLYASISPGQDIKLKGYKITAIDGCDITIMETCGNAFYPDYR